MIALLLLAMTVYAQTEQRGTTDLTVNDVPLATEMSYVFYSDVPLKVKVCNAKSWIARNFGDYDAVLQLEDTDNNRIIIKGGTPIQYSVEYMESKYNPMTFFFAEHYIFTMIFDFKDDRYRIKFEDIAIMNASEHKAGILPQEYLVPNNEVSLETRFGDKLVPNNNSTEAMKIRNAFFKLYREADEAINTIDDF